MADKLTTIVSEVFRKFRDMGDGSHAEIVSNVEASIKATAGGDALAFTITSSNDQSAAIVGTTAILAITVPAYYRFGANPTAVADGTDRLLLAGVYRVIGITSGEKLGIIKAGTGDDGFGTISPE